MIFCLARAALPVDNINGLNRKSENDKSRFVQVEQGWKDVLRTQPESAFLLLHSGLYCQNKIFSMAIWFPFIWNKS